MKIILLPGLDGTGELFDDLLPCFGNESVEVIPLPQSGDQSYESLTSYVQSMLPNENFILVAESFSGPIGAMLAKQKIANLKGIVFAATFLTPPRKTLLSLSQLLPYWLLFKLPMPAFVLRQFLLGRNASLEQVTNFQEVVNKVPSTTLKRRLKSLSKISIESFKSHLPAIYLQATNDRLVPTTKGSEFECYFENLEIKTVIGPHLILQANPSECAKIIAERFDLPL